MQERVDLGRARGPFQHVSMRGRAHQMWLCYEWMASPMHHFFDAEGNVEQYTGLQIREQHAWYHHQDIECQWQRW